jgi:hypothetical protein
MVPVYIDVVERPKPLELLPLHFTVVSEETLGEFLKANRFRNGSLVFIAMEVKDYENLSLNTAEIHRYIQQQIAVIEYYESKSRPIDGHGETVPATED